MQTLASKTIPRLLLLALCLHPLSLAPSANAADHSPFQMNGWQFQAFLDHPVFGVAAGNILNYTEQKGQASVLTWLSTREKKTLSPHNVYAGHPYRPTEWIEKASEVPAGQVDSGQVSRQLSGERPFLSHLK